MSITLILTGYNIYFQQSNNFNIWYNCAYVDCQTTNEYDLRLVSCWRLWWTILTRLTVCYFVDWLSSTWRFWWLNFWLLLFLELFLTETVTVTVTVKPVQRCNDCSCRWRPENKWSSFSCYHGRKLGVGVFVVWRKRIRCSHFSLGKWG